MEKRIAIRITFERLSLVTTAELEEKLEKVLEEYGPHRLEINALTPPTIPGRPS